jgi:hypothetical protein
MRSDEGTARVRPKYDVASNTAFRHRIPDLHGPAIRQQFARDEPSALRAFESVGKRQFSGRELDGKDPFHLLESAFAQSVTAKEQGLAKRDVGRHRESLSGQHSTGNAIRMAEKHCNPGGGAGVTQDGAKRGR